MDSSGYGALAYMLGARFSVRAAEDGHLTLLRAHGCMSRVLAVAVANPPNASKCHRGVCRDRALRGGCALIIYRTVRCLFKI